MQISKGKEEGVTSMSTDDRHYEFQFDGAELALLIRAIGVLITQAKDAACWPSIQDMADRRIDEARALIEKLEEVKNNA